MFLDSFIKPKAKSGPTESHVVITNSSSGDTVIHFWKGDHIDGANSLKLTEVQAVKLRDALIDRFGV